MAPSEQLSKSNRKPVDKQQKREALMGFIGFVVVIGLFVFFSGNFMGTESCTGAYVNGKYGYGQEGVENFKNDCSGLTKEEALNGVTSATNDEPPALAEELRSDILNYW